MSIAKNIIVFGSHGKVGQHFVNLASKAHKLSTVVRNSDQATQLGKIAANASNIKSLELTLDDASVDELSKAIAGHDVVVFTAGSGGKNLLQVDLDGAVKTFEASVLANVRRFIIVSAIHADNREVISQSAIRNYYIAKHYADRILIDEFKQSLDFTILKPTLLTDDEPTGKIKIITDAKEPLGSVTRSDVAKVILEILDFKNTYGKSYNFANGDSPIDDVKTYN